MSDQKIYVTKSFVKLQSEKNNIIYIKQIWPYFPSKLAMGKISLKHTFLD